MVKPFLKWAGGKSSLLSQYVKFFPKEIHNYFEPFLGGGAVFFYLITNGRIKGHVTLSDTNSELINVYQVIKDDVKELISALDELRSRHSHDFFYDVRNWDRLGKTSSKVKLAARTIYLNKTCYNGLYRVNSKGFFNVPLGRYSKPQIFDEEELINVSRLLQNVEIMTCDYLSIQHKVKKGDFVYLDPPYHPLSSTSNFTLYTQNGFSVEDQVRLSEFFETLNKLGVFCMESNSSSPFILNLYKNYNCIEILANRSINSNASKRKKIAETLILNY